MNTIYGLADVGLYLGSIGQRDYMNIVEEACGEIVRFHNEAEDLKKQLKGLTLALEQANATINYLNKEKENIIKEIEKRKAFGLKCYGQPKWLRKGIDVGLNTALDILKNKTGEQNDRT